MTIKPVVSFVLLLSAVILAAPATGEAAESQKGKPAGEMDKSSRPASEPSVAEQTIPKKETATSMRQPGEAAVGGQALPKGAVRQGNEPAAQVPSKSKKKK